MIYKCQNDMPKHCPPATVVAEDKDPVYRFIEGDTPTERDFLNHKELGLPYPDHKACEALALSLYTSEEAAKIKKKRVKRLKNYKIANGKITSQCGSYIVDRNEHLSLWLYKDVDILKAFT